MKNNQPSDLDRVQRPEGRPVIHQNWGKLLFLHWRIDPALLRPLIPETLEIDTFDGSAWIALAPFTMWDIRAMPPFLPPVPGLSSMHELNVRTYVHRDKVPGVWFFSLDCNSSAAVIGGRALFFLPYYTAEIQLEQSGPSIDYSALRTDEPAARFSAGWNIGAPLPYSQPGSLEFFLTERYSLYSAHGKGLYRARIYHDRWPLQKATLSSLQSTMIESLGLPAPEGDPLLHYAEEISVEIWPLRKVG